MLHRRQYYLLNSAAKLIIISWRGKCFLHYWPFVTGIHQSLVDSSHKRPVIQSFGFSLLSTCISCWKKVFEVPWCDITQVTEGGCEYFTHTVETPYNTAPYITGSNIARLGHGSQNSWSKLWIPIVKSAPVCVIFTWKVSPRRAFTVAPTSIWEHDGSSGTTPRGLTVQMSLSPSFVKAQ